MQAYVSRVPPITELPPLSDLLPAQGRPPLLKPAAIILSISAGLSLTLLAPQSAQRSVQTRACSQESTRSITRLECPEARHQVRSGDRNQITLMPEMRLRSFSGLVGFEAGGDGKTSLYALHLLSGAPEQTRRAELVVRQQAPVTHLAHEDTGVSLAKPG